MKGWLLDLYPNENEIVLWVKNDHGIKKVIDSDFFPSFYVYSSLQDLKSLESKLSDDTSVKSLDYEKKRLWLREKESLVLKVTVSKYKRLKELANNIDESGNFSKYQLFNVDLSFPLRYTLYKEIFPFAFLEINGKINLLDDINSIDYDVPELSSIRIDVEINARDRIPRYEDPISKIIMDDIVLEGEEKELLIELKEIIEHLDPDIIYTNGGDKYLIPYLFYRANYSKLDDFFLGREEDSFPQKKGRSYFTYGQVKYKPPMYTLKGRIHIDMMNSFLYQESGLFGLIELSRISRIPIQILSRTTPGTAITSIQISRAFKENTLIPWKKNLPEQFKSAKDLFMADRGGFIYEPVVGIHENVVEIDFSSLYPSIMVKYNISPETVLCNCCRERKVVPGLNYNICKNIGLIPKVLEPIIERRMEYKKREGDLYKQKNNALKWILVTSFGYTGYKNAKFGKIECHETINAYGREILVRAKEIAESLDYEVLHGIVDSLWLKSNCNDHEKLCNMIYEDIKIPLGIEAYKWIVFLPNKSNEIGALNRYYGLFENDDVKVRGIEIRRRDSPEIINNLQRDMLKELTKANNKKEFYRQIPKAIEVLRDYARKVKNGECDLEELVFTSTISKKIEEYEQFTFNVASLLQLRDKDVVLNPGERVRYIITNSNSKKYLDKVKVLELADENEKYDKKKYLLYLLKAGESLLLPFGYTAKRLDEELKLTSQNTLYRYSSKKNVIF